MAFIDEMNEYMRRAFVRDALKRLSEPSLGDVLNHPEKWRIVRITTSGFDVVPVEPMPDE